MPMAINKDLLFFFAIYLLALDPLSPRALGEGALWSINPIGLPSMENIVIPSLMPRPRAGSGDLTINLTLSCSGANNLRSFAYPFYNTSSFVTNILIGNRSLNLTVPAPYGALSGNPTLTGYDQVQLSQIDWTTQAVLKNFYRTTVSVSSTGNIQSQINSEEAYNGSSFTQLLGGVTPHPVQVLGVYQQTYQVNINPDASAAGQLNLTVGVNGAGGYTWYNQYGGGMSGYCGGWYSPLMVFFDEKTPSFHGKSGFKLNNSTGQIAWVEPNSPGYFLALDKDKNGEIKDGTELFGDQGIPNSNGFDDLAKWDANRDQIIDSRDPVFKRLVLWKDKNGDGKSAPEEMIPISKKKIVSISLSNRNHQVIEFGQRAQARESSVFTFRDDSSKIKTGKVYDVWFNQVDLTSAAVGKNRSKPGRLPASR